MMMKEEYKYTVMEFVTKFIGDRDMTSEESIYVDNFLNRWLDILSDVEI